MTSLGRVVGEDWISWINKDPCCLNHPEAPQFVNHFTGRVINMAEHEKELAIAHCTPLFPKTLYEKAVKAVRVAVMEMLPASYFYNNIYSEDGRRR